MLIIDYQQNLQAPTNYFVLSITSEVKFNKSLQKKKFQTGKLIPQEHNLLKCDMKC